MDVLKKSLHARFSPIFVKQIQMSKLHTGICGLFMLLKIHTNNFFIALVTSESEGNLRLCGFGSGGR